jgi:predicted alpha/beta superfamily hydrolase
LIAGQPVRIEGREVLDNPNGTAWAIPGYPVALAVIIAASCGTSTNFGQKPTAAKAATIWYSEQFTIYSKAVGRDFLIQVARPVKSSVGKVPVIYVLDGNSLFGEVADMLTGYGYFGDTAPAYVVGIGYPAGNFNQWLSLRNHDLIHVHVPATIEAAKGSGDGAKFQKFLLQELRPLIASRYRVDERRSILAGHSFGGLFTSHVLLNTPDAFSGYIVCSPAIWAEPQLLEKASAFHMTDPPKVFIGIGSKEEEQCGEQYSMVKNAQELAARLKDHASSADVTLTEFEGQTHGTAIPECLSHGIQFMLPAPPASAGH